MLTSERIPSMTDRLGRYLEVIAVAVLDALYDLKPMGWLYAALEKPETVVEPHDGRVEGATRSGRGRESESAVAVIYTREESSL